MTIKHVCQGCNNGWMSQLEVAAAPILMPMIEGETRDLENSDAQIVRTWATKTALNFAYAAEHTFTHPIDPELAHRLFNAQSDYSPVPNAQVWLAAYQPLGQFAYRHMTAQGYGVHPTTGREHRILRVVFLAGHAVFFVRLADSEDGQGLGQRDPLPEFAILDPESESRAPARPGSLDDSGISETFNRHIHGDIYPGQDRDSWRGLD